MKKKSLICLAMTMVLVLGGCGSSAGKAPASSQTTGTEIPNSKATTTQSLVTETAASEDNPVSTGGIPWINSNIKANITDDMSLSPKEDFYLFVNHDWLLKAEIPDGRSRHSSFMEAFDTTKNKGLAVLTDENLKSHEAALVQSFYKAILNWDARNKAGLDPIMKTVKKIQDIKTLEDLRSFICDPEQNLHVSTLLSLGNEVSKDDSSKYVLTIHTGAFTLKDPAEYKNRTELGDRCYKAYLQKAKSMLKRLGYQDDEAQTMFDSMIDLEARIADVSYTRADEMDPNYERITNNHYDAAKLADLSSSYPLMDMIKSFGYGQAEDFVVPAPEVVKRIDSLFTEDNLEAMKALMLIHYVSDSASSLDREAYELSVKTDNMISGSSGMPDDELNAYNITRTTLPNPMDQAFLEKYDCRELKKTIHKICEDLVDAYHVLLKEENWLSEETKNKAIEKLDTLKINAVYPDKWIDYSSLNLTGLSYRQCLDAIAEFNRTLDVSNTNGTVDKDTFELSCLEANAFYNPLNNSINILIGILNDPFYHEGMSKEELLGGIGALIGHEISHAFDTQGAQFDKDGNMKNWWQEDDYKAFQARADKLISYYNNITVWEGQKVLGKNIQTEAIADMGGIKSILYSVKDRKDFDYQAFFKANAAIWRAIITRNIEYSLLTKDPHPLHYLRTNVTLQQYDEFLDTFGIKEGDTMYLAPEDRINVW